MPSPTTGYRAALKHAGIVLAFLAAIGLGACRVSVSTGNDKLPEPTPGTAAEQEEAEAAARRYLDFIDREQYDETWVRAGPALRDSTNKFMWTNVVKLAHKAFGTPPNRRLDGFGFTTRVDRNAPVGEYVLVQFKSPSGKTVTTEKVVMQKEAGTWKIVGYFVDTRTAVASNR
ncbi:DUF4019 domain-containing protein [Luteimonas gilva]|uniref:DUF4019 domain-containing protein n=1 Tax=Luteimonas gilva TaxID=2572684 RepID=A0A4U5JPD4_9GAMM|nr:DUF4019 domain-containing protein [Luteimonas gilva]TKR30676.1 DUF4019 domain-containing protein [Luteimonas gilva]